MEWITMHYVDIWAIFASVVTTASLIVKLTPTVKDDHALAWLQKTVAFFALNKSK